MNFKRVVVTRPLLHCHLLGYLQTQIPSRVSFAQMMLKYY